MGCGGNWFDSESRRGVLCPWGKKGTLRHHTGLICISFSLCLSLSRLSFSLIHFSSLAHPPRPFSFRPLSIRNSPTPCPGAASITRWLGQELGGKGRALAGAAPALGWGSGYVGSKACSYPEPPSWASLRDSGRPPPAAGRGAGRGRGRGGARGSGGGSRGGTRGCGRCGRPGRCWGGGRGVEGQRGGRLGGPPEGPARLGDRRSSSGDLRFGAPAYFLALAGSASKGLPHGGTSGPRSLGDPWDLLPFRLPARRTALPRGCRLQSGRDGRPAQGGRAGEPLWLLGGSASAVAAATPELVSHRTRPESQRPSHRCPPRSSAPSLNLPTLSRLRLPPDIPRPSLKPPLPWI